MNAMKKTSAKKTSVKKVPAKKAKIKTTVFDPLKYLKDVESQKMMLEIAIESGDPSHVANVLGLIAKAQGMTKVANEVGITREGLYKALSGNGDPRLSTFLGTIEALGYKLRVEAA